VSGATLFVMVLALFLTPLAFAQTMPNPKEISGQVLPVTDIPVGTISVRLIRGSFDKNLVGVPVEFSIDGRKRTVATDGSGRAQVSDLSRGARVRATAVVDGERLESREAVVEGSGLRIVLVATDPEVEARAAEDRKLAAGPPVKGIVVLGPESRIIAEMSSDRLHIYYELEVVNSARTPVDIGGPLVFDLPREARSSTILDGSTPRATANGPRVTVTGPFASGVTSVRAAYELPYNGPVASFEQRWPAALQQLTILVLQIGGLQISSPQIAAQRDIQNEGQSLILATGPSIPAGESLTLSISGLPHHARWPRWLALSLAGLLVVAGIWGAATPRRSAA
jgi:hypothetical protein